MPNLACLTCGRVVYATASVEALFPEELRCPRCGAQMGGDRRSARRRSTDRRQPAGASGVGGPGEFERRVAERRREPRRRDDPRPSPGG